MRQQRHRRVLQLEECTSGKCIEAPLTPFCGGAQPQAYNTCAVDICQSNAECTREGQKVCIPAGALGYKVSGCMGVSCLLDADCTAEAGGACILLKDPCCGAPAGLVCSYPTGGCKKDSDCPGGGYCAAELDPIDGHVRREVPGRPHRLSGLTPYLQAF